MNGTDVCVMSVQCSYEGNARFIWSIKPRLNIAAVTTPNSSTIYYFIPNTEQTFQVACFAIISKYSSYRFVYLNCKKDRIARAIKYDTMIAEQQWSIIKSTVVESSIRSIIGTIIGIGIGIAVSFIINSRRHTKRRRDAMR